MISAHILNIGEKVFRTLHFLFECYTVIDRCAKDLCRNCINSSSIKESYSAENSNTDLD